MVSVVPQNGQTALMFAVQKHHTEIVKALLAAGADVNLQEKVNNTKLIYIDNAACVYHSLSSVSTKHFSNTFFFEALGVTSFERLSHMFTLKVATKQFHKLLIQSCPSP